MALLPSPYSFEPGVTSENDSESSSGDSDSDNDRLHDLSSKALVLLFATSLFCLHLGVCVTTATPWRPAGNMCSHCNTMETHRKCVRQGDCKDGREDPWTS